MRKYLLGLMLIASSCAFGQNTNQFGSPVGQYCAGGPQTITDISVTPAQQYVCAGSDGHTWSPVGGGVTTATMPTAGLVAEYDFHETSGYVNSDISGNGRTWTMVDNVPAGTVAPKRIIGANGGAGLAFGSDPAGAYGLNKTAVGSSCETIPVLQSEAQTVVIQFYNPPAMGQGYPASYASQYVLGSSSTTLGNVLSFYGGTRPFASDNSGVWGNTITTYQNAVGMHTLIYSVQAGSSVGYLDGQLITGVGSMGNPLPAVNYVLGCNKATNLQGPNGAAVSAPIYVFHLAFYSTSLNTQTAATINDYLSGNLRTVKAINLSASPIQTGNSNLIVAIGDSTTDGINADDATMSPWSVCLVTVNCYGSSEVTKLPNVNALPWTETHYGMPGAGTLSFPQQVAYREAKVKGDNNSLRVAIHWGGINGLVATQPLDCAWVANDKLAGYDPWVVTLYSQSNVAATDQSARDPYNARQIQFAKQCGATGVINIADDAFMGADGTHSTGTYFVTNNVHPKKLGYAHVSAIANRVLSSYYLANPLYYTSVSSATYTMNGYDRYLTLDSTANAVAVTLPDCIGATGMEYLIKTKGSNTISLTPATVTGQTETIEGTTSKSLTAGQMYKFIIATNATATAAPGGCDWQQVP